MYILIKIFLLIAIGAALAFIYAWLKRFYFKDSMYDVPSIAKRALAVLFDIIIIHFIYAAFFFGRMALQHGFYADFKWLINSLRDDVSIFWGTVIRWEMILWLCYFGMALVLDGVLALRTPGKRVLKLDYETTTGQNGEMTRLVLRSLIKPLSFILLPLTLIVMKSNKRRRGFHDLLSGLMVVSKK